MIDSVQGVHGLCRGLCRVNTACLLGCAGCAGLMRARTREKLKIIVSIQN